MASPSGFRCDVIRKLRPERMRSTTCWQAASRVSSGVTVIGRLHFLEDAVNGLGPFRSGVQLEIELGGIAEIGSLGQQVPEMTGHLLERDQSLLRIFALAQ